MEGKTLEAIKILFRRGFEDDELAYANKHFHVITSRAELSKCKDSVVIGRYSVLPYYEELEDELSVLNTKLINSLSQHKFIADFKWYFHVKDFTPESWTSISLTDYQGPFVVKGATNSRKHNWNTDMFANTKREAWDVAKKLSIDSMIGYQEIWYRKYIPLVTYEIGLNGLPFTNEWRFFFLGKECITYGYYWRSADDEAIASARIDNKGVSFAHKVANIICKHTNFFVLDIAQTVEGNWILIEVNDGQMSGLSMCDPEIFYENLKSSIDKTAIVV